MCLQALHLVEFWCTRAVVRGTVTSDARDMKKHSSMMPHNHLGHASEHLQMCRLYAQLHETEYGEHIHDFETPATAQQLYGCPWGLPELWSLKVLEKAPDFIFLFASSSDEEVEWLLLPSSMPILPSFDSRRRRSALSLSTRACSAARCARICFFHIAA